MRKGKRLTRLALGSALCLAVLATSAFAEKAGRPKSDFGPALEDRPFLRCFFDGLGRLGRLKHELNLTPEQKHQIAGILKSHKPEIAAALRTLHEKHQKLLQAVRADTINEGTIRSAARDMAEAIGEASILRARVRQEIRAVLTPEQRAQADRVLDEVGSSVDDALKDFEAK